MSKSICREIVQTSDIMPVAEAARRLGCSNSTVYEGIRRGDIPAFKIAEKRTVIPREAFERMLKYGQAGLMPPPVVDMQQLIKAMQQTFLEAQKASIEEMLQRLKAQGQS